MDRMFNLRVLALVAVGSALVDVPRTPKLPPT